MVPLPVHGDAPPGSSRKVDSHGGSA